MATRRYSIAPEGTRTDVVEAVGAATVTKSIELTCDLAALATAGVTKKHILDALVAIEAYITEHNWPPA